MDKAGFERLFEIRSREDFAEDPKSLVGPMMDLGFQKAEIAMVKLMVTGYPKRMSGILLGVADPAAVASYVSEETGMDESRLRRMLMEMAGIADDVAFAEEPARTHPRGAALVRWCEENAKKGSLVSRRFLDLIDAGWSVPSSDEEAKE